MPKCPVHHVAFPEGQECKLCLTKGCEDRGFQFKPGLLPPRRYFIFFFVGVIGSAAIMAGLFLSHVKPKVELAAGSDIEHFKSLCKKDAGEHITKRFDNVTSIAQLQPPAKCTKHTPDFVGADIPEWVLLCSDNWLADRPSNLGLLPFSHYSIFETRLQSGMNSVMEKVATHEGPEYGNNYENYKFSYTDIEKTEITSRYGYSWKFFRSKSYPSRIAGLHIDIVDTQNKTVIAYKRDYVLYRENRKPVSLCNDKPGKTGNFVQRVLRPPFHANIERAFSPSIKANIELFEGVKNYFMHDWAEAIRLLRPLAEQGNPEAAIYLGLSLKAGGGKFWNGPPGGVVHLFKTAADAGHPFGMHLYGDEIVFTKKSEALAYIRRGAENGWVADILSMSNYYQQGSQYYYRDTQYNSGGNIEIDPVKALAWLLIVKNHPDKIRRDSTNLEVEMEVADIMIKSASTKLSGEQVKEATRMAKEWTLGYSV